MSNEESHESMASLIFRAVANRMFIYQDFAIKYGMDLKEILKNKN